MSYTPPNAILTTHYARAASATGGPRAYLCGPHWDDTADGDYFVGSSWVLNTSQFIGSVKLNSTLADYTEVGAGIVFSKYGAGATADWYIDGVKRGFFNASGINLVNSQKVLFGTSGVASATSTGSAFTLENTAGPLTISNTQTTGSANFILKVGNTSRMVITRAGLMTTFPTMATNIDMGGYTITGIGAFGLPVGINMGFGNDAGSPGLIGFDGTDFNLQTLSGSMKFLDAASGILLELGSAGTLGFFGTTPIAQPAALTTQLTSITHTAPVTPDYAIQDLTLTGYGFATKDEGNTLLKVVLNLQTRLDEVEARLGQAAGGVGLWA